MRPSPVWGSLLLEVTVDPRSRARREWRGALSTATSAMVRLLRSTALPLLARGRPPQPVAGWRRETRSTATSSSRGRSRPRNGRESAGGGGRGSPIGATSCTTRGPAQTAASSGEDATPRTRAHGARPRSAQADSLPARSRPGSAGPCKSHRGRDTHVSWLQCPARLREPRIGPAADPLHSAGTTPRPSCKLQDLGTDLEPAAHRKPRPRLFFSELAITGTPLAKETSGRDARGEGRHARAGLVLRDSHPSAS